MKINNDGEDNNQSDDKHSKANQVDMLSFSHNQVSVKTITNKYHGFFKINEYTLQHQQFSGQSTPIFNREIFERGDAVVVMPYDIARDKVLLIDILNRSKSSSFLYFLKFSLTLSKITTVSLIE